MLATAILNSENANFNDFPEKNWLPIQLLQDCFRHFFVFSFKEHFKHYADRYTLKALHKGGREKGETTGCAQSWLVELAQ
jgi:hypothetical protein